MQSLFDLSQLSFDEFLSLFFDHAPETEEHWYNDPELTNFHDFDDEGVSSPAVIVEHMTQLFTNFAIIAEKFSPQQMNLGIWAMFSLGAFRLQKHLWLPSVPLEERLTCIRAMYHVYADYVAKCTVPVIENCFDMWWDFVANGYWQHLHFSFKIEEGDVASLDAEQKSLLDCMFDTLSKILELPDKRTQGFALHGLGHLHHPGVRVVVQSFLDRHRGELPAEAVSWIEECRDGTVM